MPPLASSPSGYKISNCSGMPDEVLGEYVMANTKSADEPHRGEGAKREKWERPKLSRLEANLAAASKGKGKDGASKGPNSHIS